MDQKTDSSKQLMAPEVSDIGKNLHSSDPQVLPGPSGDVHLN